ncbi:MAG: WS/DGAT domain-containing protein, partial [Actinomycetes bacterium]|nr:WS/DGAT domain-containing protein [Actinomycetes bacterium]
DGEPRLKDIRDGVEQRLARVPKLRQRLHRPGPLAGRPAWVDDPMFDIRDHVRVARVPAPGTTADLLDTATAAYDALLDRRRPLWELWLLVGMPDGTVGVLLKLHHAVADGMAAVAVMAALFDRAPHADVEPAPEGSPLALPGYWAMARENLASRGEVLRRGASALVRNPAAAAARAPRLLRTGRAYLARTGAPASSLNQPVRPGRRVRFLTIDVGAVKNVAHAHGGRLNDVVLGLWAAGLRALLASRGEPVAGVELVTAVAASLRDASGDGGVDNRTGAYVLPLPIGEADPDRRLARVVATTSATKAGQRPAAVTGVLASLAGTPFGRAYVARQRANNTMVTNVPGPPERRWFLGAPVRDVLPIIQLIGNVGLTLCAFSYAGHLSLVVTADAAAFEDLDVLMRGMEREWTALRLP